MNDKERKREWEYLAERKHEGVVSSDCTVATLERFLQDGKMSRESYQTPTNICRAFVHTCATLIIVASAATREDLPHTLNLDINPTLSLFALPLYDALYRRFSRARVFIFLRNFIHLRFEKVNLRTHFYSISFNRNRISICISSEWENFSLSYTYYIFDTYSWMMMFLKNMGNYI